MLSLSIYRLAYPYRLQLRVSDCDVTHLCRTSTPKITSLITPIYLTLANGYTTSKSYSDTQKVSPGLKFDNVLAREVGQVIKVNHSKCNFAQISLPEKPRSRFDSKDESSALRCRAELLL